MAALQELLDEQARIKQELQRMENSDETTEETDGDFRDSLLSRWEELDAKTKPLIERMEKIKAITRLADDEANLERPDGGSSGSRGGWSGGSGPDLVTSRFRNPYDNNEAVRSHLVPRRELRGRALDAIELEARRGNMPHDFAEAATAKAQDQYGGQSNIARHILMTGSEEYQEAFREYVEDPQGNAQRAAMTLTLANGGYLLPFVLDPTIVLTNTGSANPYRRISNVKQTTSNTWNGVTSAGINAALLAEGAPAATDAGPTVGNIAITPVKAAAWLSGSYEVLEDTNFGEQLPRLLADAKDRLEENNFAVGAGTTGIPQGITVGATVTFTTATTLVVAIGDLYGVQGALPPRFRNAPGAAWVANVAQINRCRQLDTAGGASFWTNLGRGAPETLLGAPIYESSSLDPALTTLHLIMVFGDFGQFYIVDRVGVSLIYEPLVKDQATGRPLGNAGWFMFWRFSSKVSTPNGFITMVAK
jgi:HK97 family phage major capsid protein